MVSVTRHSVEFIITGDRLQQVIVTQSLVFDISILETLSALHLWALMNMGWHSLLMHHTVFTLPKLCARLSYASFSYQQPPELLLTLQCF